MVKVASGEGVIHSGTEWLPTPKQLHEMEAVRAKIQGVFSLFYCAILDIHNIKCFMEELGSLLYINIFFEKV